MPFDFATPRPADSPTVALLRAARLTLSDPSRWVQGCYETFGHETLSRRYCAAGAVRNAGRTLPEWRRVEAQAYRALLAVAIRRGFTNVEQMNDRSTHEEVLTAFDEAIAREVARG